MFYAFGIIIVGVIRCRSANVTELVNVEWTRDTAARLWFQPMREPSDSEPLRSKTYRLITVGVGALFVAIAVAIAVLTDISTQPGALLAAVIIGVLGFDALLGAIRNKRSLLSRIGPLP